MKKIIFVLFIGMVWFSAGAFAQDTMSHCNCYQVLDSPMMQPVAFTLGADSPAPAPPYYMCNTNTSQRLKLPFNFCFYGKNYDSVYIGNKGNITFGRKPVHTFTNGNFPAGTDTAMIAPFWANMANIILGPQPPNVGEVWYKIYPHRMVVIWSTVIFYRFDCDFYDSFQLTISDGTDPAILGGNNVSFCYNNMEWASADSSGGSMGFAGVPATVGINKGDKTGYAEISRFSLPGAAFFGRDSADNGTYWLNNKQFIFNTCVTGENIPPVVINPEYCDTVNICAWDTGEYVVSFLCAVKGQTATFSATSPTLSGITVTPVQQGNGIYDVRIKAITNSSDIGYNTITVTATDNSSPAQSINYPIVFNVGVCTGVNEVEKNNDSFTVYPNASNGNFTFELTAGQTPENCSVHIYNTLGQQVYTQKLADAKTPINLTTQPKGMYFIRLMKDNKEIGTKMISLQ